MGRKDNFRMPCCYCGRLLAKPNKKNGRDAQYNIICLECDKPISEELGKDWQTQDWWQEYRSNYVLEQVTLYREKDWSTETLADQEAHGYLKHVPKATIKGTSIEVHPGNIHMIITRLYKAYGYGSRQMATLLKRTYRIKITFQAVEYHLAEIKDEGIVPDENAKFWRTWHASLYRMDKLHGLGAGAE